MLCCAYTRENTYGLGSVLLVYVDVCDLLQRQLLQIYAVTEQLFSAESSLEDLLYVHNIALVVYIDISAHCVFHGHRQ